MQRYHITHEDDRWVLKEEGDRRVLVEATTKEEIISETRDYMKLRTGSVKIHIRREKIFPVFCQIVLEGVKKGEIRSDLDARLFLEIFYFLAQEFVNPDWLVRNDYAPTQLLHSIMRILFFGIFLGNDKTAGRKTRQKKDKKKRKGS
ncbi:MAG: DUF2188 domain-containing protein [Candidatus Aminicenantes bacterium]|nr:DUF2188 domain-containing protein [Candidatus Aminicenantes bacterium]